jgi:hypothetical protein
MQDLHEAESVRVAKKELSEQPKLEMRNSKFGGLEGRVPWDGKECVIC